MLGHLLSNDFHHKLVSLAEECLSRANVGNLLERGRHRDRRVGWAPSEAAAFAGAGIFPQGGSRGFHRFLWLADNRAKSQRSGFADIQTVTHRPPRPDHRPSPWTIIPNPD